MDKSGHDQSQDREIRDLWADHDRLKTNIIEALGELRSEVRVLSARLEASYETRKEDIDVRKSQRNSERAWAVATIAALITIAGILLTIGDARVASVEKQISTQASEAAKIHETLTRIAEQNSHNIEELQELHKRNSNSKRD